MPLDLRSLCRFTGTLLAVFLLFSGLTMFAATTAAKRAYDIPAAGAEAALKAFSQQSGKGVIASTDLVQGVTTNAVKGEFTAAEALDQLLIGTGLIGTEDRKSGTFAVRKETTAESKNGASRLAEAQAAPANAIRDGAVQLEKFEVRSSRIDGLNNKGLLQGGADAALYHDVVTRVDIERMGVTSIEELFRLIPQTSSPSTSLQAPSNNARTIGGLSLSYSQMGLRGFSSAQTVILVNGRALPRSGTTANGGADLSRIPLAAIERVEVLPYAGSAIYGAGAIGGAVNIILRKEYTGREITAHYGTSVDGGATEYRLNYVDGRTFNEGRTQLTTTFSYQHRDELRANERDYLNEALRRYGPDSTVRDGQGMLAFETYVVPAFAGAPGTILLFDFNPAADLGIPGQPGRRYATVPAGTTYADSFLLTPDSFSNSPEFSNPNPRYGRSILYEPLDSYSLNVQLEHEFVKDRLSAYGEFTVGYNRKKYSFPQTVLVFMSLVDPLNPFRLGVTPGFTGRNVILYLDTPDLPEPDLVQEFESARAVMGLKGKIGEDWEWSADATVDFVHNTSSGNSPTTNVLGLSDQFGFPESAPAEVRRAIYPVLADHTLYPISSADVGNYFQSIRRDSNRGLLVEGNARLTGDVFELPAGPLQSSVVGKFQKWKLKSASNFQGADGYSQLMEGTPFVDTPSSNESIRSIWQGAIEVNVPVIGKNWRPIPVEAFDIQGSASIEANESSGTNASSGLPFGNKKDATNTVIAAKLQITRDLALRGSYSEGFYPPDWSNLSDAVSVFTSPGNSPDPKRGNTRQLVSYTVINGGNPQLKPETATSENVGLIFTPRFVPGLTLSLDYWKIKKVDAIVRIFSNTSIANPDLYGFLITRAAPTADDLARGWLGIITEVDQRATNAAQTLTEGIDGRLRYSFRVEGVGDFDFNANVAFTNNFLLLAAPGAPMVNTANGSGPLRLRGNASLTWTRDRWSVTATARYTGHYSTNTTDPSPSFPGAYPLDGGRIPAFVRWDLQASYEVPARSAVGSWRDWISGTRFTIGMLNVLNEEPAFVTNGHSFYNSYDDPRQGFVYLSVRKNF